MAKKNKIETLAKKSKKKKDFLIIGIVIGLFAFLAFSAIISIMSQQTKTAKFQKRIKHDKQEVQLIPEKDIKETWAISIENTLSKQQEVLNKFMEKTEKFQKESTEQIKDIVFDAAAQQKERAEQKERELAKRLSKFEEKINKALKEQDLKIQDIADSTKKAIINIEKPKPSKNANLNKKKDNELDDLLPSVNALPKNQSKTKESPKESADKIVEDLLKELPSIQKQSSQQTVSSQTKKDIVKTALVTGSKSDVVSTKSKKRKFKLKSIEVDNSKYYLELKKEKLAEIKRKKRMAKSTKPYHVMLGLAKAYMITGAYAPAFSAGQVEPLPVLMQAEGDILIANNDTENIDKCLLIGSAKGNMNSQTADIRLVKISCSINGGKKMIEGSISGWVIGENGIPGLEGTLIHKNGALIARTFVAGFLQAFASALGTNNQTTTIISDDITTTDVKNTAARSFASGTANVFEKIGGYYLKMAEQIFPVVEVKGGRTINIILKGGENLILKDLNKVDVLQMEEDAISEEISKLEEEISLKEASKYGITKEDLTDEKKKK